MAKHPVDHRKPSQGARVAAFLRIAKSGRTLWHRSESLPKGNRRLVEFMRIERGREA